MTRLLWPEWPASNRHNLAVGRTSMRSALADSERRRSILDWYGGQFRGDAATALLAATARNPLVARVPRKVLGGEVAEAPLGSVIHGAGE